MEDTKRRFICTPSAEVRILGLWAQPLPGKSPLRLSFGGRVNPHGDKCRTSGHTVPLNARERDQEKPGVPSHLPGNTTEPEPGRRQS